MLQRSKAHPNKDVIGVIDTHLRCVICDRRGQCNLSNPWLNSSFVSFSFSDVPGGRPAFLFDDFSLGRVDFEKLRLVDRADLAVVHTEVPRDPRRQSTHA